MGKLTEGYNRGEFLISEAEAYQSREQVTLVSGQSVVPGEVLGQITTGGKYAAHDEGAADGTEDAVAIAHEAIDASGGDLPIWVMIRDCVVNDGDLTWPAGISGPNKTDGITNLALTNIRVDIPV